MRKTRFRRNRHLVTIASLMIAIMLTLLPTAVAAASDDQRPAARLSAGLLHSAMINYDGQLYVWGDNVNGQLGIVGEDYCDIPQLVELPDKAIEVSLGSYHTMVLLADGTVWTFGRNAYGQLGDGTTQSSSLPVMVADLPKIVAIAAGSQHSMALGEDGSVWAWGNNTNGQVGDVPSDTIIKSDGQVFGTRRIVPATIVASGATAIAAGGSHSMYLSDQAKVYAWGNNSKGQLGDGTTLSHNLPSLVPGLDGSALIAAGYDHSLSVIRHDGFDELMAWGDNSLGQLGTGGGLKADSVQTIPMRADLTGDQDIYNDHVLSLFAGYAQSAVTVPAGDSGRQRLLIWGSNSNGQLAQGDIISQNQANDVDGTFNYWTGNDFLPFDDIALGGNHVLVLSSKGLLAASGHGDRGQLGNASILDRNHLVPVTVPDVIRPVWVGDCQVSAGYNRDGALVIRWPAAQDNQTVAGYLVSIANPKGLVLTTYVNDQLTLTYDKASPTTAYEITVMACDINSIETDELTLSRLVGYVLPAAAAPGDTAAKYFADVSVSVPQVDYLLSNWHPDSKDLVRPLEVPWDISSIYGKSAIQPPADWVGYALTAVVAIILILLMVFDFLRRKNKWTVRNVLVMQPRREQQTG